MVKAANGATKCRGPNAISTRKSRRSDSTRYREIHEQRALQCSRVVTPRKEPGGNRELSRNAWSNVLVLDLHRCESCRASLLRTVSVQERPHLRTVWDTMKLRRGRTMRVTEVNPSRKPAKGSTFLRTDEERHLP